MRLICLLIVSLSASGAVYFVDPSTGNDANNGTAQGTPWAHLPGSIGFSGAGWVQINNGDKVVVKGGSTNNCQVQFTTPGFNTYNGASYPGYSGSAIFDSILVQSGDLASPQWGTGRAIFDEQNTRVFGFALGQGGGTALQGLTVDGFEVRNVVAGDAPAPWSSPGQGGSSGMLVGANNPVVFCSVKRCWIHDCFRIIDNEGHGIETQFLTNYLFYYNQLGPNIGTKSVELFACTLGAVTNNYFNGVSSIGGGDHAIAVNRTTFSDVANNLIYKPTGVHSPTYGISLSGSLHNDMWNNVIFRDASGSGTVGGLGTYPAGGNTSDTNHFYFNTIAFLNDQVNQHDNEAIVLMMGYTGTETAMDMQNNLIYKCATALGPVGYLLNAPNVSGESFKFNDIFYNSPSDGVMDSYHGGDNIFTVAGFNRGVGSGTYASNVQVDPALGGGVLPTGLDANYHPNTAFFSLLQSSPSGVKSTGNVLSGDSAHGYDHTVGKFSKDILGNARSGYSMGAYEWVVFPPQVINVNLIFSGKATASGKVLMQ